MSLCKKCQLIGLIFLVIWSTIGGILLFNEATVQSKHHWDNKTCTLNSISNNTWLNCNPTYNIQIPCSNVTIVNVTLIYREKTYYTHAHTQCSQNITFVEGGTSVNRSINCDWIIGHRYNCWVYHTFPEVPNGLRKIGIYKTPDNAPNQTIIYLMIWNITFGIVLMIPIIGTGILCLYFLVKKMR